MWNVNLERKKLSFHRVNMRKMGNIIFRVNEAVFLWESVERRKSICYKNKLRAFESRFKENSHKSVSLLLSRSFDDKQYTGCRKIIKSINNAQRQWAEAKSESFRGERETVLERNWRKQSHVIHEAQRRAAFNLHNIHQCAYIRNLAVTFRLLKRYTKKTLEVRRWKLQKHGKRVKTWWRVPSVNAIPKLLISNLRSNFVIKLLSSSGGTCSLDRLMSDVGLLNEPTIDEGNALAPHLQRKHGLGQR